MEETEKEPAEKKTNSENFFSNQKNIWIIVSGVLFIALVLVFVLPSGMSEKKAGDYLVSSLNSRVGGGVTLDAIADISSNLYEVNVSYNGQLIPVYMTKDGEYMAMGVQKLAPITGDAIYSSDESPKEVPKSDKPKVEAFVFSYCPYGLQFQKALSPVYALLKNKADINLVAIGAMHGEFEKIESLRQMCIQKNYGKDKLWAYLDKFMADVDAGNCNGDDACLTPILQKIMTPLGIDKAKIDSCIRTDAETIYNTDMARAESLGIGGSPTFVINGVEVSVGRTPEAVKAAVCDAFTTAPSECSQTLSSQALVPGFGASAGTSTGASC